MSITVTVAAAAARLGVRVDEVYRLIRSGRLRATKIGTKRWQIDPAEVEARLNRIRGNDGR